MDGAHSNVPKGWLTSALGSEYQDCRQLQPGDTRRQRYYLVLIVAQLTVAFQRKSFVCMSVASNDNSRPLFLISPALTTRLLKPVSFGVAALRIWLVETVCKPWRLVLAYS